MDLRLLPAAGVTWLVAWWLTKSGVAVPRAGLGVLAVGLALGCLALLGHAHRLNRMPDAEGALPQNLNPNRRQAWAGQLALSLAAVLATSLTVASYHVRTEALANEGEPGGPRIIVGKVITEPRPAPFGGQYLWTLAEVKTGVQFEVSGSKAPYRALVEVTGTAKPIANNGKPIARLSNSNTIVLRDPKPWWRATNTLRENLLRVTAGLSEQGAALVPGMAIGDTSRVDPELNGAFKVSGLSHLTAVSGGHFAVILVALTYLTGGLNLPRWGRCLAFALVAAGFVMLVRPDPAVIRAAAMCAVSVLATIRGRKAASMPALAASIIVLLIGDPWLARSFGFALSCAASGGLALFSTPLAHRLTPWLGAKLSYLIAVPLVAQAACGPILLLFSDGVATLTVLANLLVGPAVAPATLLSLAATMVGPFWPGAAAAVAQLASGATWWIFWVATRCAGSRLASLPVASGIPAALGLVGLVSMVGAVVWRWKPRGWPEPWKQFASSQRGLAQRRLRAGRRRFQLGIPNKSDKWLVGTAYVLALSLLFGLSAGVARVITSRNSLVPRNWQVAACDVGQGDAMLIRTGEHAAILIDTGNDDGAVDRCLKRFKITTIELLVLSHYHSDHAGGVQAALAGRRVQAVMGPAGCPSEISPVTEAVSAAGVSLQQIDSLVEGSSGGVNWAVLGNSTNPANCNSSHSDGAGSRNGSSPSFSSDDEAGLNDQSLVFFAKIGSGEGALTLVALGDLETSGQEALLRQSARCQAIGTWQLGDNDIVKVAHHGSAKQSAALAHCLSPQVAVFSVGSGNTYGHPTTKALDLYAQVGAYEVRTDTCGTAAFTKENGTLTLTCLK